MAEIRGIVVKKQGERAEIKVDKTESELTHNKHPFPEKQLLFHNHEP